MKFYELLQTMEFSSIWECLQTHYKLEDRLFRGYQNAFQDLCNAIPVEAEKKMLLAVAKVHDEFEDDGYCFDVYGIWPGDSERYALEFMPWEEWLSFEVIQKSLALHGTVAFVAHALYELTFFGFSIDDAKQRVEKEIAILAERAEDAGSGKAKIIPAGKAFEELGCFDDRMEAEKQHDERRMRNAIEENKRVYASLLDESDSLKSESD